MQKIISFLTIVLITAALNTACSTSNNYAEFDTNPNHYKTAQLTKNVDIPKYIAANIETRDLYPVDNINNNSTYNKNSNITPVPPTLAGKITEYN